MIIKSPVGPMNIIHAPDIDIMNAVKRGFYEPHVQNWIYLYGVGKCLDIGSNVGIHSLLMSKMGLDVSVIEGNKEAIRLMEINYKANSLKLPAIYNAFVGNGSIVSFIELENKMGSSYTTSSLHGKRVPTRRVTDIIDFQPNLIKMDIEGAELIAINESEELFKKATLIIELNKLTIRDNYGYHINDLVDKLFEIYKKVEDKEGEVSMECLKSKLTSTNIIDVVCHP